LQKWQKQPIAPVAYYVFDLLWHNESDWTAQSLINRREQLNKILKSDGRIQIGGYVEEHGIELFRLAKESAQRDWSRRFGNGTLRSPGHTPSNS
jgi:ATP-dependent DNA ligase